MVNTAFYEDFLREQGFAPTTDLDGDIVFEFEERTLFISVQEKDPNYFRMVLPNFWEIRDDNELIQALLIANDLNRKMKVATVIITEQFVSASAELFIQNDPQLGDFFPRLLRALVQASVHFAEQMQAGDDAGAVNPQLN
jgi:hypothetical protein